MYIPNSQRRLKQVTFNFDTETTEQLSVRPKTF
jgi:hypothetical protein